MQIGNYFLAVTLPPGATMLATARDELRGEIHEHNASDGIDDLRHELAIRRKIDVFLSAALRQVDPKLCQAMRAALRSLRGAIHGRLADAGIDHREFHELTEAAPVVRDLRFAYLRSTPIHIDGLRSKNKLRLLECRSQLAALADGSVAVAS